MSKINLTDINWPSHDLYSVVASCNFLNWYENADPEKGQDLGEYSRAQYFLLEEDQPWYVAAFALRDFMKQLGCICEVSDIDRVIRQKNLVEEYSFKFYHREHHIIGHIWVNKESTWGTEHYVETDESCTGNYVIRIVGKSGVVNHYSEKIEEFIGELFKKDFLIEKTNHYFHTVVSGQNGLSVERIDKRISEPLIKENYEDNILKSFNRLKKNLEHNGELGRLTILNGPPGTGKTYFIRGLINELENFVPIVISSTLINEASVNALFPTLQAFASGDKKMLLILEDADNILVTRDGGNMSFVSSLLNFADGFMGEVLDLYLLATTNAETLDIDDAIKRPGRLNEVVNFQTLPQSKALDIYERLTGNRNMPMDNARLEKQLGFRKQTEEECKFSLAEVYRKATEKDMNFD